MSETEDRGWLYWVYLFGVVMSFGVILAKAINLTVIRHNYYEALARDNRMVENVIPAARGEIVDRKGRLVAESIYQYYKTENNIKLLLGAGGYDGSRFEGLGQSSEIKRHYLYGESLGLLTGYLGKVNDKEVGSTICGQRLDGNQTLGRGGVEQQFECDLRGTNGKRLVEVDAKGSYVRELGREEPVAGKTVSLSLDAYWQDKIYKVLNGRRAVVVMSDPKTGKILTLVSSPGFDPNAFSFDQNNAIIETYLGDHENLPLLNRAISGRYHPGSVFKIVMATGGLEEGVINESSTYEDTGIIKVGDYNYTNWLWTKRGQTDGMVSIVKALQRSNDIFFYKLGGDMGVDRIKTWADKYGFGAKTGIELPGEQTGIVPDEKWKMEARGEKWFLGNTYHMSIGQGDLDATPLQVNQMTNVIANNGKLCSMSILKDSKANCRSLGIKSETVSLIREGMMAACHTGGTAWPLFNFKTELACKTGTAEVGDGSKDTHAWLTAFAPADDPQVSITVMVERGGEGSDIAAPIVGDILKEWFNEPETKVPRYNSEGKVTMIGD